MIRIPFHFHNLPSGGLIVGQFKTRSMSYGRHVGTGGIPADSWPRKVPPKAGLKPMSLCFSRSHSKETQSAPRPVPIRLAILAASSLPKSEAPKRRTSGLCSRIRSVMRAVKQIRLGRWLTPDDPPPGCDGPRGRYILWQSLNLMSQKEDRHPSRITAKAPGLSRDLQCQTILGVISMVSEDPDFSLSPWSCSQGNRSFSSSFDKSVLACRRMSPSIRTHDFF